MLIIFELRAGNWSEWLAGRGKKLGDGWLLAKSCECLAGPWQGPELWLATS